VTEDKVRTLLHRDTGEIDQCIAESLIDRSNAVSKLARPGKRQRALVVRAIDLLPGQSDEYVRVVTTEMGGILTRRKLKAEKCGIGKNVWDAPVRSLIACQRIDGSESSSQSMTVTDRPPAFGCIPLPV
jgi:hypothetical protein